MCVSACGWMASRAAWGSSDSIQHSGNAFTLFVCKRVWRDLSMDPESIIFVFGAWIRGWGSLSCFWIGLWEIKYARVWGYMCLQMKDILAQSKTKTSLTRDMVVKLLSRAHQCVRVHVALVNLTKSHDKVWKFLLKVTTKTRFQLPAPLFLVPESSNPNEIYRFFSPTN